MCTVTFIPRSDGFLLGMNRDEKWERGRRSVAPRQVSIGGVNALLPKDDSGGTWIAANEHGLAFTILNRNLSSSMFPKTRSRGHVITALVHSSSISGLVSALGELPLQGTHPFTLLAFSRDDRSGLQVAYDGVDYVSSPIPWQRKYWFSSGLSDKEAHRQRILLALAAAMDPDRGSQAWMRRLHQQHGDSPGPFSICVHREDVGTVSYTEIDATRNSITMSYSPGSPCKASPLESISLAAA